MIRLLPGELWKRELEHVLLPMLEKYDVVLVEAPEDLGGWRETLALAGLGLVGPPRPTPQERTPR